LLKWAAPLVFTTDNEAQNFIRSDWQAATSEFPRSGRLGAANAWL